MISKERASRIYLTMHRIRGFEEQVVTLFESNKLRGSVHHRVGQKRWRNGVFPASPIRTISPARTAAMGMHCERREAGLCYMTDGQATGYCRRPWRLHAHC